MRKRLQDLSLALLAALFLAALHLGAARVQGDSESAATAPGEGIPCRVLEVHTSREPNVTVVVFHQQESQDRARLSASLRAHSGESIEFETRDGARHAATLLRLKSCFGRGLLLFPVGTATLAEKEAFVLRFPGN